MSRPTPHVRIDREVLERNIAAMQRLADASGLALRPTCGSRHGRCGRADRRQTVAVAVFTGITAWETHQDRGNITTIYCSINSDADNDLDLQLRELSDQLGC